MQQDIGLDLMAADHGWYSKACLRCPAPKSLLESEAGPSPGLSLESCALYSHLSSLPIWFCRGCFFLVLIFFNKKAEVLYLNE